MELTLLKKVAEEIGFSEFKQFGINKDSWGWKEQTTLNLVEMGNEKLDALRAILENRKDVRGTGVLIKDIDIWKSACMDSASAKPRTVKHFRALLTKFLARVPGHRIYKKHDQFGEVWLAYYVSETEFHPRCESQGRVHPAFVSMEICYEEFGGKMKTDVEFYESDIRGASVAEALARQGFYVETPEYRENYLAEAKRFGEITTSIGKQFYARGIAVDDLDGNKSRESSWYYSRKNTLRMERQGGPTRVVIDVFFESDKSDRRNNERFHLNTWFWGNVERRGLAKMDGDDEDEFLAVEESPEIEIPIHPFAAVFDLSKHLRLRIHINYLTEYVYDQQIAEKLILPPETKELVKLLIEHKDAGFKDIVKGKSGGAVVLLTGKPGVGKTLTAEVYAESEERALYSVQCSQLGTDPEALEDELLKVFARARRWNAVCLLDEADVYVHERGNDLEQNAIVGVFLRVLEYQDSVLFLTTNRPDDVDDAIASRCIARLSYEYPTAADQKRIWRVLAEASDIALSGDTIDTIVAANPMLSGRDVKNLLKLAKLVESGSGDPITLNTIEFVKSFKPTGPAPEREADTVIDLGGGRALQIAKPKREITEDAKAKLAEGRERYWAAKRAAKANQSA